MLASDSVAMAYRLHYSWAPEAANTLVVYVVLLPARLQESCQRRTLQSSDLMQPMQSRSIYNKIEKKHKRVGLINRAGEGVPAVKN